MTKVTEKQLGRKIADGEWELEYRNDATGLVQVLIWKGPRPATATFRVAA